MKKILFLFFLILAACATKPKPSFTQNSGRTVIFFLIDGLSLKTLKEGLESNQLPAIKNYFGFESANFYYAHSTFPSLTYSAIGSLLTEKPISENGLIGNHIYGKDTEDLINFESPSDFSDFNRLITGKNIFYRLKQKGQTAVSLAYAIHADTDPAVSTLNLNAGLGVLNKDYTLADGELLIRLENILNQPTATWPDFIFVHLTGVDFTSHDVGPQSPSVLLYLRLLDRKLSPVFQRLSLIENNRSRKIVTLLSADHGFDESRKKTVFLEDLIHKKYSDIRIINEGRYLALYLPETWNPAQKSYYFKSFIPRDEVDLIAFRNEKNISVQSKQEQVSLLTEAHPCSESSFAISIFQIQKSPSSQNPTSWICPENLPAPYSQMFYPYFLGNISFYFKAANAPDGVIIAKPGISFKSGPRGLHGGPTASETLIPLLMKNSDLKQDQVPAIWQLLRFM